MKVPADHIRLLLSPPVSSVCAPESQLIPTRSNILTALYDHLRDNRNIRKGDNLLFYFAGHGSRYAASDVFQDTGEMIETLCPADRGVSVDGAILDISDRELSIFLEELRAEKGDHITVVLDCCHSGSALGKQRSEENTDANE